MGRKAAFLLLAILVSTVGIIPKARGQALERPAGLGEQTAKAVPPFKMFDNLYYVGLDFVCAYVIRTNGGLILVDTLFGQYADHTAKAMQELGLNPKDVRYIIITHGHDDHYAGLKTMKAITGARVMMSEADWALMEKTIRAAGEKEIAEKLVPRDIVIKDGDTLKLGDTTINLYITPGHTAGSISLQFPVYENGKEYKVFNWAGPTLQSNDVPMIEAFLNTTKRLRTLTQGQDVWLHSHPWSVSFFQKYDRLKVRKPGEPNPYVNPGEIAVFLQQRLDDTEKRLAQAKAKAGSTKP